MNSVTRWLWFLAWVPIGALGLASLLAAFADPLILAGPAVALGCAYILGRSPAGRSAFWGASSGAATVVLYVAFLNRDGPGEVCTYTAGGSSCSDRWTPWPFLVIGLVCFAGGFVAYSLQGRGEAAKRAAGPRGA